MRTRHVIGIGAVPAAAIAALMHDEALAAVEHLLFEVLPYLEELVRGLRANRGALTPPRPPQR
jgi:hypothetical protein